MVDFLSPSDRSERMSRIRGKDTQPELALRKALHRMGFRYRLHEKRLPGRPDIVLPRYKVEWSLSMAASGTVIRDAR